MKLQHHLGKISWSIADKISFIIYGFVYLKLINSMDPGEVGLFAQLILFHTWIFILTDAFALQNIIQFGAIKDNQAKVNLITVVFYLSLTAVLAGLFVLFSSPISVMLSERRIADVAAVLPLLIFVTLPKMFAIKLFYRDHEMSKVFLTNIFFFGPMIALIFIMIPLKGTLLFADIADIYIVGSLTSSVTGVILSWKKLKFSTKGELSWKNAWGFSMPNMFANGLIYLPRSLDKILIQIFFETRVLGIYEAAKTLYRVFDEAINAANGLIYPAAVRIIERRDKAALNQMVSKAISFIWMAYFAAFIVLELGGTSIIIKFFLNAKYFNSIGQFNVLLLGLFFQPFITLLPVMTASGRYYVLLRIVAVSTAISFAAYIIIGLLGSELFIPLGNVVSLAVLGMTALFYLKKEKYIEFGWKDLFRAFSDSRSFLGVLKNRDK